MPVNLKELEKATKGGIYCIAPDIPVDNDGGKSIPFYAKIGRTTNFKTRLNSYHLCFNGGFRTIAILPLRERTSDRQKLKLTIELEKEVRNLLGNPKTYGNRVRTSEWYAVKESEIKKAFTSLHNSFKKGAYFLTKPPIFEFDENHKNIFEIDTAKKIRVPMYVKKTDMNPDNPKITISRTAKTKVYRKKKQSV